MSAKEKIRERLEIKMKFHLLKAQKIKQRIDRLDGIETSPTNYQEQ